MLLRLSQPEKALSPTDVTFGRLMLLRLVHPEKVMYSTDVAFGKLMLLRLTQPEKAQYPTDVTPGRLMLLRLSQPEKADSPTDVTPTSAVTLLILSLCSYQGANQLSQLISPLPLMVRAPLLSSSCQLRFSPQLPLKVAARALPPPRKNKAAKTKSSGIILYTRLNILLSPFSFRKRSLEAIIYIYILSTKL